jgi:hypothetical protein
VIYSPLVLMMFIATWDLIDQTEWGLDVKARILPVYEKIFDIEFPLPKLDTLVVRTDSGFASHVS